ncbi:MAG: TatD family hydrolase [Alphaproteobacteria bacterium]|nr:TatD family hydrolase [Alphaproteobacteria bacterium]
MFIDTHCHLTDPSCAGEKLNAVIARAAAANVGMMICPGADPADMNAAFNIAKTHDNIYCTLGIHPDHAGCNPREYITDEMLRDARTVGVGEIGLDYHERDDNKNAQMELFDAQLNMAREYDLPVAIHTRDAVDDTAHMLKNVRGVMHCYTSGWDLARIMLDRGFFFSASGILTFKNADDVRETFAKIPIDRIVIETDTPYCAPVPYRGKVCEPAFVIETARVLANIKNLQMDALETILWQNTHNLYPKIK